MLNIILNFLPLYIAALFVTLANGLLNTYIGLKLTSNGVSEAWVGALTASYYLGTVFGAKFGYNMVCQIGRIKAFAICASLAAVFVLEQALFSSKFIWLILRFLAGIVMVTQFMVIEGWLNEGISNLYRGRVMSFYILVSGCGVMSGQFAMNMYGISGLGSLILVGIFLISSIVPVMLIKLPANIRSSISSPFNIKTLLSNPPAGLGVLFIAGNLIGAFFGLAPVYAAKLGLLSHQVTLFIVVGVASGLLAQIPLGLLSDRTDRSMLIKIIAILFLILPVPLWGWSNVPFWLLLIFSGIFGVLQFSLYPLGVAFSNDTVQDENQRTSLSAVLLVVYGLGACVGPFISGTMMAFTGYNGSYYIFNSICGLILLSKVMRSDNNKHAV